MKSSRLVAVSLVALVSVALGACATLLEPKTAPVTAAETAPAANPAYLVVLGTLKDRKAFMEGYAAKLPPLYQKYGGAYLAIGGQPIVLEGNLSVSSFVLAKWPSVEAAQAFWNSPEYDLLRRARIDNAWGEFTVLLLPGLPVPVQAAPGLAHTNGVNAR